MSVLALDRNRKPTGPDAMRERIRQKRHLRRALDFQLAPVEREGAPKTLSNDRIDVAISRSQLPLLPRGRPGPQSVRLDGRPAYEAERLIGARIRVRHI